MSNPEILPDGINAIDGDGNVVPLDDVFPGFELGQAEETDPVLKKTYVVGTPAVEKRIEIAPVHDMYPDRDDPPIFTRLQLADMTPALFKTLTLEGKRLVALTIRAHWEEMRRGLQPNFSKHTHDWLKRDQNARGSFYESWDNKLKRIYSEHKKLGEGAPWIEFYTGTFEGIPDTTKARLHWDVDYATAMKNAFYQARDVAERSRTPQEPWRPTGPMTYVDAVHEALAAEEARQDAALEAAEANKKS